MSRSRKFGLILLTGGWTLLIGAIVALIGNGLLECGWMTPERARMVWMILEAAMILLPVLQYICGILSEKLFRERSVARQVRIWEQEKEKAHRAAAEGKPSHISHLYRSKVLLGVIYLLVLFTGNMATLLFLPSADNAFITGVGQYFIPYNLAVCGLILGRILTSVEIRPFKGMITLKRRSFRYLYKMARKAERKCRVHGRIRITMTADRGVSIATYGIGFRRENYLSVDGVSLDSLTEEELYSVFLHEFAHRRVKKSLDPRHEVWGRVFIFHSHTGIISRLEYWLVFYFCQSLFFYLDCFQKVANEYVEELADQLAVRLGDPDAIASALVKLDAYKSVSSDCRGLSGRKRSVLSECRGTEGRFYQGYGLFPPLLCGEL